MAYESMRRGLIGVEGVDQKEMSGIVSSAILVILPTDTSVGNVGRQSPAAGAVSMGGGPDLINVNGAKSGLALSVVGQTSWIGRIAEIAERQKLVAIPGIQILVVVVVVVVEVINTAIIEEMETGMGATEVEAEIIVTIGGATGVEDMVNGMRRVKEGGKLCDRVFFILLEATSYTYYSNNIILWHLSFSFLILLWRILK